MGYAVDEHFAFYAASFLAMRGNLFFPFLGKTASYLSNFKCVHTLVKRPIVVLRLNKLKSHHSVMLCAKLVGIRISENLNDQKDQNENICRLQMSGK